jgi:hypothetical protein
MAHGRRTSGGGALPPLCQVVNGNGNGGTKAAVRSARSRWRAEGSRSAGGVYGTLPITLVLGWVIAARRSSAIGDRYPFACGTDAQADVVVPPCARERHYSVRAHLVTMRR